VYNGMNCLRSSQGGGIEGEGIDVNNVLTLPTNNCVRVSLGGFVGEPRLAVAAWITASISSSVGWGKGGLFDCG
jgi:hypothetical protein